MDKYIKLKSSVLILVVRFQAALKLYQNARVELIKYEAVPLLLYNKFRFEFAKFCVYWSYQKRQNSRLNIKRLNTHAIYGIYLSSNEICRDSKKT